MAFNYNQATLIGRLTRDPDFKKISESCSKATFNIAIDRNYKKEDGEKDTDFIPITLWGKKAEVGYQLLKKGVPVLVWGRIQISNYEKGDERIWRTEINAENFQILERKKID